MDKFVYTVIGHQFVDFNTQDGRNIHGYNIWVTYPSKNTEGLKADKIFLSSFKLDNCGYAPAVGDNVTLMYNRFGKVEGIYLA